MIRQADLEQFIAVNGHGSFPSVKPMISFLLHSTLGAPFRIATGFRDFCAQLKCLTLEGLGSSLVMDSILSHCHHLQRLTLVGCVDFDFRFLKKTPRLTCLADICFQHFEAKHAIMISNLVPNLKSISFHVRECLPANLEAIGRELRFVTRLMLLGKSTELSNFVTRFCMDHSLFSRVSSLRLFVLDNQPIRGIATKSKKRPQSSVSEVLLIELDFRGRLCSVCGQRKKFANWICHQCEC